MVLQKLVYVKYGFWGFKLGLCCTFDVLYVSFFLVAGCFILLTCGLADLVGLTFFFVFVSGVFVLKSVSTGTLLNMSNQMYPFFMDWVSVLLIVLSLLVVLYSVMASMSHISSFGLFSYFMLMFFIMLVLIFFFSVWNFMVFFFLFEFVLLPMVFIIVLWSSQKDRLMANYYFFMYTIIGGFPLLLFLVYFSVSGYFFFSGLLGGFLLSTVPFMLGFCLAFLCKLPIYSLHIWLPKAHVEAPVGSSMVLAGLLLKMSGYGVLRFFSVFYVVSCFGLWVFVGLLFVGMLYPLIICYRQSDIKSFIAYSSVGHMCVAVIGLILFSLYGLKSAFIVFLSHGVISPSMFFLGNLIYERLSSRVLLSMGSMEGVIKSMIFYFLLFFIANMSYPPFISFFGELCVYFGILGYSPLGVCFVFLFVFVSGVVMFMVISKVTKSHEGFAILFYFSLRENFLLFSMLFFLSLMTVLVSVL